MKLGIRLLFVFFLLNGLAAFFVLRVFVVEIRPSVREVMEDMMVDTANILAELASDDLAAGRLAEGRFATHVRNYASRPVDARIWGLDKQSLDFRVYVTDARGFVLFDSENTAQGQDYSSWRDVARTLRGEYGARATRTVQTDERTSVMYVAAPVLRDGAILGVLTVAKPQSTVQRFVDRAERKVLLGGLLLLALSAGVGVAVTLWVVWSIRKLRRYALNVQAGEKMDVPRVPGELGELAQAMEAMRARLEGRDYIEGYVRALTHELKSPVAGEVAKVLARTGELSPQGVAVVTVVDLKDQWVVLNVREDRLQRFAIGNEFDATLPALGGKTVKFKVYHTATLPDFATWRATRAGPTGRPAAVR